MKLHRRFATSFSAAVALMLGTLAPAIAQGPFAVPETPMTIQVPQGSVILTRTTPGEKAKHNAPWVLTVGGPTTNGFRTNILVLKTPAPSSVRYDASAGLRMSGELKQAFPGATSVTTGPVTVGGEKGAFVAGIVKVQNKPVHTKVVQTVHAGQRYTITFTCADSVYVRQVAAFDKTVGSIQWK